MPGRGRALGPIGAPGSSGPPSGSRPRWPGRERGRDAVDLARSAFQKDLHATVLYAVLAVGLAVRRPVDRGLVRAAAPGRGRAGGARRSATPPASWPRPGSPSSGPSWSAGPRRCWPRRSWRPGAGPTGWPPRTCPTSRGSSWAGSTSRAPGMMAGDFYDVYPTVARPHGRGHRRRGRPRHRAVHHRLPGQVPAAQLPPPVP